MDEDILAAIIRLNKPVALLSVEPLHNLSPRSLSDCRLSRSVIVGCARFVAQVELIKVRQLGAPGK
jgi:hypothetical protein